MRTWPLAPHRPKPQALTPLTIGRNRAAASALGALWGFGHSTGQLILGLALVLLKVRGPLVTLPCASAGASTWARDGRLNGCWGLGPVRVRAAYGWACMPAQKAAAMKTRAHAGP